ncbi:MAG: FISUMP domain-containing protein [Bacteroidetes bacterium]|nr:FISUMP domain-containing protein [Bacteroidota bacterium]
MKRLIALAMCAVSLGAAAQLPDYVPTDGLVAWYPFNENSNDESGNEHHADLNFDAALSHDRFGLPNASVFLDGQQDHVSTPAIFNSGLDRTISIWIDLLNADDVTNTIWNTDPHWIESIGWNTYFLDEPGISYCLGDATDWLSCATGGVPETYFNVAIDMSSWKHLVSVKEGVDWRFYIDGSLVHDSVIVINSLNQTVPLVFGAISCCGAGGYGEEFTGSIDDIGIWNRALSVEEIQELYIGTPPSEGCTDESACNYDATAMLDDESCLQLDACGECGGDGTSGCTDSYACNFDAEAACDDGSCDFSCCPGPGCCHAGTIWDSDLQQCIVANPSDSNFDGCVQLNDLLDLLSAYGDCGAEESPWQCGDLLEYQGYDYETVQIGEQCWFAENLRAEKYRNGDIIPDGFSAGQWSTLSEGARAVYGNNDANLLDFGYMFNWRSTVDERGLCPSGWHVPSHQDHLDLVSALSQINQGCTLVTEESGLGMKYGGYRKIDGSFTNLNVAGYYWSTSPETDGKSWGFAVYPTQCTDAPTLTDEMFTWGHWIEEGFSVRCIKDAE